MVCVILVLKDIKKSVCVFILVVLVSVFFKIFLFYC